MIIPNPFLKPEKADPLQRDQWDRPIIYSDGLDRRCPDVEYCKIEKHHGHYQRASTFAGLLDDGKGLAYWQLCHLALQLSRDDSDDLRGVMAGLSYDPAERKELRKYVDMALERAKLKAEANNGTAVHRFAQINSPPTIPQRYATDIAAYWAAMKEYELEPIDEEIFIVNDKLKVAGSLDTLSRDLRTGFVVVTDTKTGQRRELANALQVLAYTDGERYDPETGQRSPLHADLDTGTGYLVHLPLGQGRCDVYALDLEMARTAAQVAVAVRTLRQLDSQGQFATLRERKDLPDLS